jgi:ribosomal-protein-serine acetyltransferase
MQPFLRDDGREYFLPQTASPATTDALIRPFVEADVDELVAAVRESYAEVSPWMAWCKADYSAADAETWIRSTITGRASGTSYHFAVLDAEGVLAGSCGINRINDVDQYANLGYWVRTSRAGRGLASAAVTAVAERAFANTRLNRLEIVVAVGNAKSDRVASKVGAVREAVLHRRMVVRGVPSDATMYSLVRPPSIRART